MSNIHTKDLIEAIKSGDSQRMQDVFSELAQAKVNNAIEARRMEIASSMFESVEEIDEAYPKHQDLSGISTDKLKSYLDKQNQKQGSGEGNQIKRVRIELQRREKSVSEEIDEAFINGREWASQGVIHPTHAAASYHKVGSNVDFYAHGTGDKLSGTVVKNDGKEVHFKADKPSGGATHKFKVSATLPKPVNEETLEEATVKTDKYSWGTMKTIHHGADFSIPLHPEHHEPISKLKDNQEHKFKDETGHHWTAKRMGDYVHFQGANNGGTTKVKHSELV